MEPSIQGPLMKHAFAKNIHKGEDAWMQHRDLKWGGGGTTTSEGASADYSVFGIFDGHGGKMAATWAARHMLQQLQTHLGEVVAPDAGAPLPEGLAQYAEGISAADSAGWQLQDQLVERLPEALKSAFVEVEADYFRSPARGSGSTGTVAVLVGWQLLVANVGDSCAYLDTGAEVVQVSGNHRLDDSKAERKRCERGGAEIARSELEGKPVGPLRVWPGGLAMSRTLGDYEAGSVVLSEPEVRQVTLPSTGGRLIIASDGLWDAVHPKTAAHHVRGMPASKATSELANAALRARGLRDDITIIVVDLMPGEGRLPPLLAKPVNGRAPNVEAAGTVDWHKPLEEVSAHQWRDLNWQRRLAAVEERLGSDSQMATSPAESTLSSSGGAGSLSSAGTHMELAVASDTAASEGSPEGDDELSDGGTPTGGDNTFAALRELAEEDAGWETVPARSQKPDISAEQGAPAEGGDDDSSADNWSEALPHHGARTEAVPIAGGAAQGAARAQVHDQRQAQRQAQRGKQGGSAEQWAFDEQRRSLQPNRRPRGGQQGAMRSGRQHTDSRRYTQTAPLGDGPDTLHRQQGAPRGRGRGGRGPPGRQGAAQQQTAGPPPHQPGGAPGGGGGARGLQQPAVASLAGQERPKGMVMVVPRPRQQQDEVPAMASSADSAGPQQRKQVYNSSNRQRRQGRGGSSYSARRPDKQGGDPSERPVFSHVPTGLPPAPLTFGSMGAVDF